MKKLHPLVTLFVLLLFSACNNQDNLVFTALESEEGIVFENSFSSEYLLSTETEDNIAERFVWSPVDFDTPINSTYELQASLDAEFESMTIVGATNTTNLSITIKQLLAFAQDLGLDNDPTTLGADGLPNNTGVVHFRVRGFTGTGNANSIEVISVARPLFVKWVEQAEVVTGCPSYYAVGAGAADAGWSWDTPAALFCNENVYAARINLANDIFRFFETQGDWDSGLNYPYFLDQGYTIDPLLENANDSDGNFYFGGTPGIYQVTINTIDKTITLSPSTPLFLLGDAVPSGWDWTSPVEALETNAYIRTATLAFSDTGTFRFFTVKDDWGSGLNFPYYEEEGYTIDARFLNAEDGDSNFSFIGSPGEYTLTINELEKTITLE